MSTALLILWGCVCTLLFSVAAQLFHIDLVVVHVPVAMAAYCAARRRPFDAWIVTWLVGWSAALLAGGGRGPMLLALMAVCGIAVFSRRRLKLQSNFRLAATVTTLCIVWSVAFTILNQIAGGPSFWRTLVVISPLSAAVTGIFSLLNTFVLRQIDPDYTSGGNDGPRPLRVR